MAIEYALEVTGLSKRYKLYDNPIDRLKETFHPFQKKYHTDFYALRDLSFAIPRGEIFGIVGKNGAGKSTLLQIIAGVLTPSSGQMLVHGKISALLELGAGFNPDLSGLDNIYFMSSLLGYSEDETAQKMDEILDFAEIGDFVYQPVKTYSSGMFVRLAFAVAINVDPDILIVDEALSVGDFRFRQKCLRRIAQFRSEYKTIIFVSHDIGAVIEFCTQAMWLLDGKCHRIGSPKEICQEYISYMSYGELTRHDSEPDPQAAILPAGGAEGESGLPIEGWVEVADRESYGERKAVITRVLFCGQRNRRRIEIFEGGERVIFLLEVEVKEDIAAPIVGFHLADGKGIYVLGFNTATTGEPLAPFPKGIRKRVEFEFDFPYLKVGNYSISPAIADGTMADNTPQHWVHDACLVRIASKDQAAWLGHYLVIKDNVEIRVR